MSATWKGEDSDLQANFCQTNLCSGKIRFQVGAYRIIPSWPESGSRNSEFSFRIQLFRGRQAGAVGENATQIHFV
jgi:hypothetical protein